MDNLLTVLAEQHREQALNLLTEIRRIMRSLEMDDPLDELGSAKEYSFLDLIEGTEIVKEVVIARLKEDPDQYNNDRLQDYRILFHSIEQEAKEAIKSYFRMPGHKSHKFVTLFNSLVTEKIVETLKASGYGNAKDTMEFIAKDVKDTILHNTADTTEFSFREAQKLLASYKEQRKRTYRDKKAVSQYERVEIIKKLHQMTS